jgi:hypothetical protein
VVIRQQRLIGDLFPETLEIGDGELLITPPTAHSNQLKICHDSTRQQYGMYIIHYSIEHIAFSAEYTLLTTIVNFNLIYRYSLTVKALSITV